MPDPDFLPAWYRELRRRRRWVVLQAAGLVVLVGGLALGAARVRGEARRAERELTEVHTALTSVRADRQRLDALRHLRDQWRRQDDVLASAGLNVEASRMLAAMESIVPPGTALTDLRLDVEDRTAAAAAAAAAEPDPPPTQSAPTYGEAAGARAAEPSVPTTPAAAADRRLKVAVRGLAPGEVAVGNLLSGLSKVPLFRHVHLTYAKDHDDRERSVREFEVTFQMDLAPDAAEPQSAAAR